MLTVTILLLLCTVTSADLSPLEKAVRSGDSKIVEQVVRAMAKGASAADMEAVIEHALLSDKPALENAALKGLDKLTPEGIEFIHGPGCSRVANIPAFPS
ncbi:MAG: hypothetical protein ACPG7R_09810, partial [Planctomycetota bacterium]